MQQVSTVLGRYVLRTMAAARGLVDDNRGGVMEFFVMTGKATSDCHLEFMCPVAI